MPNSATDRIAILFQKILSIRTEVASLSAQQEPTL